MPPNIQLENGDVAIVIKADGKLMLFMPDQEPNDAVPYNVLVGTAFARALVKESPALQTMINETIAEVEQANKAKVYM